MEALEQNVVPLLRCALKLHDVGLCRGALTLLKHGAWAFQAPKVQVTEALELYAAMRCFALLCIALLHAILFAAVRFEEANLLFCEAPLEGVLRTLVARTWLDSAIAAHDQEAVEQWLLVHQSSGLVSMAVVSYATAYATGRQASVPLFVARNAC